MYMSECMCVRLCVSVFVSGRECVSESGCVCVCVSVYVHE